MKVRMKVQVSGTREGCPWPQRGSVVDLPDNEAKEYCESGMAEPVATFKDDEETAVPLKTAETRRPPGGKGKSGGKQT